MKSLLLLFSLLLSSQLSLAQVEETHVDFIVSPMLVEDGKVQIAFEWLTPQEFRKTSLSQIDLVRINTFKPDNNQIIAAKMVFISSKSFNEISHAKMNNANFVSYMLNSVGIKNKEEDVWFVTNKVRAFNIPFKVSFDFKFKEVSASALGELTNYFENEAAPFQGSGKERYLLLDMTNFSQLMYRNYSIVYVKELTNGRSLVVSGVVTGFDLRTANTFFNFPPFSSTEGTMMANLKSQILHIVRSIQK